MIWNLIQKGGPATVCIIITAGIGLWAFLERLVTLITIERSRQSLMEKIHERLKTSRTTEALALCELFPGPASRLIKAVIEASSRTKSEIDTVIEEAFKAERHIFRKNMALLGSIAGIATLFGLLGTVLGLISASSGLTDSVLLSEKVLTGIRESLYSTATGITVAIPATIGYNYMVAKTESIKIDLENNAAELVRAMKIPAIEPQNRW